MIKICDDCQLATGCPLAVTKIVNSCSYKDEHNAMVDVFINGEGIKNPIGLLGESGWR